MRLLALALVVLPLPSLADSYQIASAPTAVTVYNGFAMVTREVSVDVKAGAHEVVLPDMPQWLDAGSLRVRVTGARLVSMRVRTDALPPQQDSDSPAVVAAKAQISQAERALRDLDDAVQDAGLAVAASEARLVFLADLGTSETLPSDPLALAGLAQMIEVQTLAARQAQLTAQRAARLIAEGRTDLEEMLADARAALAALTPPADPRALLALSVTAQDAGTLTALVSYPADATWQPTYDIDLTTGDTDRLTVRRAALVYQNSGENWENVMLTLSTLAPSGQVIPSELYPPLLLIEDPQEQAKLQRSMSGLSADSMSEATIEATPAPQPNFDGPGVTYTLPARITIAQSAEGARVELDALEFDARVFARAVPAYDSTAFVMAQATNLGREPLLASSSAQIFLDGALVGQSSFDAVPAGGDIVQSFGPIEDLRLSYAVLDRSAGERGVISRSNAQTQEIRLGVENLGQQVWDVELRDAIPYSEQDDLVIDWNAQPRADLTNVDDQRGLAQWNFSVAAGATQQVLIGQTVKWPDGMVLR
jgi:uncharacterized protein (TIGR02231 family)